RTAAAARAVLPRVCQSDRRHDRADTRTDRRCDPGGDELSIHVFLRLASVGVCAGRHHWQLPERLHHALAPGEKPALAADVAVQLLPAADSRPGQHSAAELVDPAWPLPELRGPLLVQVFPGGAGDGARLRLALASDRRR